MRTLPAFGNLRLRALPALTRTGQTTRTCALPDERQRPRQHQVLARHRLGARPTCSARPARARRLRDASATSLRQRRGHGPGTAHLDPGSVRPTLRESASPARGAASAAAQPLHCGNEAGGRAGARGAAGTGRAWTGGWRAARTARPAARRLQRLTGADRGARRARAAARPGLLPRMPQATPRW